MIGTCRRTILDAPINIRGLKLDAVNGAGTVPAPACASSTGKRVAIIGGGGQPIHYNEERAGSRGKVLYDYDAENPMTRMFPMLSESNNDPN